ncbi:MAG: helix-turn-helix transcriptional regulator [Rikenellaceae bacterium]|nr:helix-turn-helix transcriptional regulator [Rikenellaceae bacterium]MBQ5719226.1 helix-turn-helix transcriptional regulator [Alistipes sp.]
MREKLLKLMKSEKLSSSRLAEILEIQPSSISHILSGRNKPSFDFLVKILRRFPTLNPDWLLLDSDQMYRQSDESAALNENQVIAPIAISTIQTSGSEHRPNNRSISSTAPNNDSTKRTTPIDLPFDNNQHVNKPIERIIVLYSDKSFEAFNISSN